MPRGWGRWLTLCGPLTGVHLIGRDTRYIHCVIFPSDQTRYTPNSLTHIWSELCLAFTLVLHKALYERRQFNPRLNSTGSKDPKILSSTPLLFSTALSFRSLWQWYMQWYVYTETPHWSWLLHLNVFTPVCIYTWVCLHLQYMCMSLTQHFRTTVNNHWGDLI